MIRTIILCSITCFAMLPVLGQRDTLYHLEPVQVTSYRWKDYLAGSKTKEVDSILLLQMRGNSLADLMAKTTGVHIKSYGGSGQLASVAFRGSSASQTTILWNGLPVNSLTLGQSDLSQIPIYIVDQVDLQYGSGSALYGSGAVGGTIHLRSLSQWGRGLGVNVYQETGSFGSYKGGLRVTQSGDRWEFASKAYYHKANNNFKVRHLNDRYRQPNASVSAYGFSQRLGYKIDDHRHIFIEGWYQDYQRDLQPVLGDLANQDHLLEQSLKTILHYRDEQVSGVMNVSAGYLNDFQRYNNSSGLRTKHWIGKADYLKEIHQNFNITIGGQWRKILALVPQYQQDVSEDHGALFASFSYRQPWLHMSFNARQSWAAGFQVPFVPSFGTEITLFDVDRHQLMGKFLFSKSYRVPSLNDRYWRPGGNLNLKPENGLGAETSLVYVSTGKQSQLKVEGTYYRKKIKDWIIWIPGGTEAETNTSFWYPDNLRKVKSRGLELNLRWQKKWANWAMSSFVDYAYTKATNETELDRFDRSKGKQLPFIPRHRGSWSMDLSRHSWSGHMKFQYTGKRYIETNNESAAIPSYHLLDLGLSRTIVTGSSQFMLAAGVNNLFNLNYQSMSLRAMPGRNYQLSINYQLQSQTKL